MRKVSIKEGLQEAIKELQQAQSYFSIAEEYLIDYAIARMATAQVLVDTLTKQAKEEDRREKICSGSKCKRAYS